MKKGKEKLFSTIVGTFFLVGLFFILIIINSVFASQSPSNACPDGCRDGYECTDDGCQPFEDLCNGPNGCAPGWKCVKGNCTKDGGGGGGGGGNGQAISMKCNCSGNYNACDDYFGKTNIQYKTCTYSATGSTTCNWTKGGALYYYVSCGGNTSPTPTPPGGLTGTPAPTSNPKCKCTAGSCVKTECDFNKLQPATDYKYENPIKCGVVNDKFKSVPSEANKNDWCRRPSKTKGDANGDDKINLLDYFYYVAAKSGAKLPPSINPDFNGDNQINAEDRKIIIKTLSQ